LQRRHLWRNSVHYEHAADLGRCNQCEQRVNCTDHRYRVRCGQPSDVGLRSLVDDQLYPGQSRASHHLVISSPPPWNQRIALDNEEFSGSGAWMTNAKYRHEHLPQAETSNLGPSTVPRMLPPQKVMDKQFHRCHFRGILKWQGSL
jgi:hypothetical protein